MTTVSASAARAGELNVITRAQRSLWSDAFSRLLRNRAAIAGMVVVLLSLLVAVFAPALAPKDPFAQDTGHAALDPFWGDPRYQGEGYPLGSDQLGRDVLSRLIWSARISIVVGFVPVVIILAIGVTVGLVAGFYGRWVDNLLMRFVDIVYAFPDLLFVIIIVTAARNTAIGTLASGLVVIFVSIAVVSWVGVARLVRGQVLSLKQSDFVESARAMGATDARIIMRHLLPNVLAPIIVSAAFSVPGAMLAESTLSFLGIGIKPPTASWGVMINEGFTVISQSPWPVLLPALCISVVMLGFTFLGDGLRDALDPRQHR